MKVQAIGGNTMPVPMMLVNEDAVITNNRNETPAVAAAADVHTHDAKNIKSPGSALVAVSTHDHPASSAPLPSRIITSFPHPPPPPFANKSSTFTRSSSPQRLTPLFLSPEIQHFDTSHLPAAASNKQAGFVSQLHYFRNQSDARSVNLLPLESSHGVFVELALNSASDKQPDINEGILLRPFTLSQYDIAGCGSSTSLTAPVDGGSEVHQLYKQPMNGGTFVSNQKQYFGQQPNHYLLDSPCHQHAEFPEPSIGKERQQPQSQALSSYLDQQTLALQTIAAAALQESDRMYSSGIASSPSFHCSLQGEGIEAFAAGDSLDKRTNNTPTRAAMSSKISATAGTTNNSEHTRRHADSAVTSALRTATHSDNSSNSIGDNRRYEAGNHRGGSGSGVNGNAPNGGFTHNGGSLTTLKPHVSPADDHGRLSSGRQDNGGNDQSKKPSYSANNSYSGATDEAGTDDNGYDDIIGSYYDEYSPIVDGVKDAAAGAASRASPESQTKQKKPYGDMTPTPPAHPSSFLSAQPLSSPHYLHHQTTAALRSTYKSEPMIHAIKQQSAAEQSSESVSSSPHSTYSQTLENALFYSTTVDQIRDGDFSVTEDSSAAVIPRARPGKDDIRQRRARNVIASREVLSIVSTSTYISIPSERVVSGLSFELVPPVAPPGEVAVRAIQSEPSFRTGAQERRAGDKKIVTKRPSGQMGSGGSGSAVPLARFLPRQMSALASNGSVGSASSVERSVSNVRIAPSVGESKPQDSAPGAEAETETEVEADRPAYTSQPLLTPSNYDIINDDEDLDQEGVIYLRAIEVDDIAAPSEPISRNSVARNRAHSIAESDALGSDDGNEEKNKVSMHKEEQRIDNPQSVQSSSSSSKPKNRLSIASEFSTATGSSHISGHNTVRSLQRHRRNHNDYSKHVLSSQSKKVAMRLLMRAGFSRIAIRVARMGVSSKDTGVFENNEAMSSSMFEVDDSASGVDLDPNGLQGLKSERRKQIKKIDEHGFIKFEGDNERESEYAQQYEAWRAKNPEKAAQSALHLHPDSEGSWNELMNTFDSSTLRNSRKVKQLVQAGMPPRMRARIYYKLSGAAALEKSGEYARLVALEKIPIYDVIERDVSRCYPDHSMFADADGQGQRQLRRILRAYSQYNAEVGYCQGMGRLVGLFLIIGLSEERAFWVLAATIKEYVPNYYLSDLGGLRLHTAVFDSLLRERNPKLHAHLSEQGCDALMYVTPWFMTIFTLSLPWETALRVWDWFIYRGTKVLFRVALAITDLASNYLLAACPTIAEQLGFFLHIPPSLVAPDVLIGAAVRVKLTERHIERLTRAASASMGSALKN